MATPQLTRRQLLTSTLGAVCASTTLMHSQAAALNNYRIVLQKGKTSLLEQTDRLTNVWTYGGSVPGPIIKAKKGEQISIEVVNRLEQPTSVHWHGIRIENAMDGVSFLTQDPIEPGDSFTYKFVPPDAGTYWYHPHNRTWEQLARGLYGALIIEGDEKPGEFDRDYPIIVDDWRLKDDGSIDEETLGSLRDWSHQGRLGNILTLNGKAYEDLPVLSGERVRLRFINTANARIMRFGIRGQKTWLVALDGQPVPPVMLDEDGISIAPAQRADLVIDVEGKPGDKIAIVETSSTEPLVAGYLTCGNGSKKPREHGPKSLVINSIAKPDLSSAASMDLVMSGGAMRFLTSAIYKGNELDGRTLARNHQQLWAFNGQTGMSDKPLFSAKKGETIRLNLKNETAWPHAIHLHGHHFKVLAKGPSSTQNLAPTSDEERNALRDTVLVERDESVEIAFVADNPGKWMLHCHMLEHQASGMGTWFEVT